MRIGFLVPSLSDDDAVETPTTRLLVERLAREVELTVFATTYPTTPREWRVGRARAVALGTSDARFTRQLLETTRRLRAEHLRRPFDALHALWLHPTGTLAIAAGRALRLPVIASVGGAEVVALPEIGYGALRSKRGRLLTARVLLSAEIVTGGSAHVVRQARRVVPHRDARRFRVAPLPVEASRWAAVPPGRAFDPNAPRVLHAASLIPVKDQATLLRAFQRVAERFPGATLEIAGEDPHGLRVPLERQRDELGLAGRVTFLGRVPHREMPELMARADLFALSSLHESQGMVVLEAAAASVPTVGTAVGVVADLAPEAAVATRPGDPDALGAAMTGLLSDPERLQRLGRAARERVARDYDIDVAARRFHALYSEAVEARRR